MKNIFSRMFYGNSRLEKIQTENKCSGNALLGLINNIKLVLNCRMGDIKNKTGSSHRKGKITISEWEGGRGNIYLCCMLPYIMGRILI